MSYKYKDKEYQLFNKNNINIASMLIADGRTVGALLNKLEDDGEIEKKVITVYNLKFGDGYYTDDEIDLLLDDLLENEIISNI